MNAQRSYNQVGRGSSRVQTSAGGGGAEPVCPSRKAHAAKALSLHSRRGGWFSVMALAAKAWRDGHEGSAPPGAKAPALLKWNQQELLPTWFLSGCSSGASRKPSIVMQSALLQFAAMSNRMLLFTMLAWTSLIAGWWTWSWVVKTHMTAQHHFYHRFAPIGFAGLGVFFVLQAVRFVPQSEHSSKFTGLLLILQMLVFPAAALLIVFA